MGAILRSPGRTLALGIVAGVAILMAVMVYQRVTASDGVLPGVPVDIVQKTEATDSGITLRAGESSFSGTGTYIRFQVVLDPTTGIDLDNVARILVPQDGKGGSPEWTSNRAPVVLGANGGTETTLRMPPIQSTGPLQIRITALDFVSFDLETTRVNGDWALTIQLPDDLTGVGRLEQLSLGSAMDEGIEVNVLSALRSRSETVITVQAKDASGAAPVLLTQPVLLAGDSRLMGGVVDTKEDGSVLTFSFPPTPFGSPVTLELGPWTRVAGAGPDFTTVDLGRVLQRQGVRGKRGESAAISPADILSRDASTSPVLSVTFGAGQDNGVLTPMITFILKGNYEWAAPRDLAAVKPDGSVAIPKSWGSSYRKDAAGTVTGGTSNFSYELFSLDEWDGVVTIHHGNASSIVRGDWGITLKPVK